MRRIAIACVVLLLAAGAQASKIEDATGVKYQYDGGTHGDASDICEDPSPTLPLGNETEGLLVPVDDPLDNYGLQIGEADVGDPVTVRLRSGPPAGWIVEAPAPDYDLAVHAPGCGERLGASSEPGGMIDEVTFVPQEAGVYTIQVQPGGDPEEALGPTPEGCHGVCVGTLNTVAGYGLSTSAS